MHLPLQSTSLSVRSLNHYFGLITSPASRTGNSPDCDLQIANLLTKLRPNYCVPELVNQSISLCSNCSYTYFQSMLGSVYGRNQISPSGYTSLLSSCSAPTASWPITLPSTSAAPSPTAFANCTGTSYTVATGDTCQSIASAHSVAIDRFLTDNSIDRNCSTLTVGSSVCIGASCQLYTVKGNDTCGSILANQTFYQTQLLSWNP